MRYTDYSTREKKKQYKFHAKVQKANISAKDGVIMAIEANKGGRPTRKKNPFTDIFTKLVGDETQQEIADRIGVSRQNIGKWLSGNTTPDIETLCKIATAYNVSTDYLLGRSDVRVFDPSQKIQAACEVTGLSEKAVQVLRKISQQSKGQFPAPYGQVIDFLLSTAGKSSYFGGNEENHKLNPCAAFVAGMGDYITSTLSTEDDEADFLIINGKLLCSSKLENLLCDCEEPEPVGEEEPVTISLIKSKEVIEKVLFDRVCEALKEVKNIFHDMNGGDENGSNNPQKE